MEEKTLKKDVQILFISFMIILPINIVWHIYNYNDNLYEKDQTLAKLDRSISTSKLSEAIDYCEEVYDQISKFSGNPMWHPWKTDKTNWNKIKSDLKDVIDTAKKANNNTEAGEDAYEEALDTLREKIKIEGGESQEDSGLYYQIEECYDLEIYQRTWLVWWIITILLYGILILLVIFVFWYWDESYW